ncbi:putative N-acetyl-gamma-glutamyl-phosphate reductase [Helianthus annuus]|nr:putative N-acetyl-gamma-glutamyl-phosphate reductase [Helianthus annuus]
MDITLMTAEDEAGESIESVFPHLVMHDMPDLVAIQDADFSGVDAVFSCLPPGTSQEIIKGLPSRLKIVDLSADFTLRDVNNDYVEWYGQPQKARELQKSQVSESTGKLGVFGLGGEYSDMKEAVYGLTEIHRKKIQSARLVANPGCYPTAILLPLVPLIRACFLFSFAFKRAS